MRKLAPDFGYFCIVIVLGLSEFLKASSSAEKSPSDDVKGEFSGRHEQVRDVIY